MHRELVLPSDFENYAWEVEAKGYFLLAVVRIAQRDVPVTFYEPVRLAQDVAADLDAGRHFCVTRLRVVEVVTKERMLAAVQDAPASLFE